MRTPHPAALLVEHPAMPEPEITGEVREALPEGSEAAAGGLPKRERHRVAVQLTAAVALLAEFDLWPARSAFAGVRLIRSAEGVRAVLGRWPLPLSQLVDRLGGGEGAAEALRSATLARIAACVGLPRTDLEGERSVSGLSSFGGAVAHQLRELAQPLDVQTVRSLWALRWTSLPVPEVGLVELWRVPRPSTARRFAAALWCDLRRRGRPAWVLPAGGEGGDTSSVPAVAGKGTVIVVGRLSNDDLNALSRWVARRGCSAVGIGSFPRGWQADAPPLGRGALTRHLAVTGLPPDAARGLIEGRQARFAPFDEADRAGFTDSLRAALAPRRSGRAAAPRRHSGALRGWLALAPDGLPPGFVALHARLKPAELDLQAHSSAVVRSGDRWRLPNPVPLERDPRHLRVAGLHPPDAPEHLLHAALGGADSEPLERWARERLDHLDAVAVRELLSTVAGGALGDEVQRLLAEACLAVLDLLGARNALLPLTRQSRGALELWCSALDPAPGDVLRLPSPSEAAANPRAAAETAALVLDESARHVRGAGSEAAAMLGSCRQRLQSELARRLEIEEAYRLAPERLDDASWRRRQCGGHAVLRAQLAHRRALWHLERGMSSSATRLLEVVARDALGPGPRGAVELDLGAAALSDGRSRTAEAHHLRAYHLLRSAGFRHRTSVPLFNLAVADVDQLRVRRAAERLDALGTDVPGEPFVVGEQARLALAVGDEAVFRRRLEVFERAVDPGDPRFAEGLALLCGVRALLDGDLHRAADLFTSAGTEGESWLGLATVLAGGDAQPAATDDWGVARAASLLGAATARSGAPTTPGLQADRASDGLALALAERLRPERLPVPAELRSQLVATLRRSGLEGWADALAGLRERSPALVGALARVVESRGLETMEPQHVEMLEAGLGVSGLEVRDGLDGSLIWRHGHGDPGNELRQGRLAVVPLGGSLDDDPCGRLVAGVLDVVLPRRHGPPDSGADETGFFGESEAARSLRRDLRELGPTHLPVLLVGETGVGKEVAARALHGLSRRQGAFVAVNVAAIPATLLEAELFGSVKGAFTGADRSRRGLVAAADGGTLFLDEIGDLEAGLQVKLLRFIESREVRAVGADVGREVDVRIVSATHRDLDRKIREGSFRRDLYYRIAAPEVAIAPLRSRTDDIPLLRDLFEREAHLRHGLPRPDWSAESEAVLRRYNWPGNVRELRQVVEVAMVRAQGGVVRPEHLPISSPSVDVTGTWDEAQREFRRRFLTAALRRNAGNRSATARELGISRQALLYHLRNLDL